MQERKEFSASFCYCFDDEKAEKEKISFLAI
jgi:hypothetical protein